MAQPDTSAHRLYEYYHMDKTPEDAIVLDAYGFNRCVGYQKNKLLGMYQGLTMMDNYDRVMALELHKERL